MGLIAADESDSVVLYSEGAMFFRFKKSGQRTYIQIVENKRVDGAVRQSVIANLGRADELAASGALASLLATGAKLTDQVLLINALDEDADGALSVSAKRIGGPLLFDKIWDRLGVADVLGDLLKDRAFELVSRPEELHPRPLAERSVRLSPHFAPIRRTCRSCRSASEQRGAG